MHGSRGVLVFGVSPFFFDGVVHSARLGHCQAWALRVCAWPDGLCCPDTIWWFRGHLVLLQGAWHSLSFCPQKMVLLAVLGF